MYEMGTWMYEIEKGGPLWSRLPYAVSVVLPYFFSDLASSSLLATFCELSMASDTLIT